MAHWIVASYLMVPGHLVVMNTSDRFSPASRIALATAIRRGVILCGQRDRDRDRDREAEGRGRDRDTERQRQIDDQNTTAWYNLDTEEGGSVGGQQYTEQQCYIKALEIDN